MSKFRTKFVTIDAIQWYQGIEVEGLEEWVDLWGQSFDYIKLMHTTNGPTPVREGDWIVTGPKGAKQVCSPDIFVKTYEPVE
jgi:hypothetical protein